MEVRCDYTLDASRLCSPPIGDGRADLGEATLSYESRAIDV
jgi:hypothetical protein